MKAKRLLAILLCLCLVTTLVPMTALAENTATVSFSIRTSNGASGSVSYRFGNEGEFVGVTSGGDGTASVNVPSGATTITVKAAPTGEYKVNQQQSGIWVNGNNTLTADAEKTAFFTALVGENGYTYTLTENTPQFQIEFDNNDGTGGGGQNQGVNANNIRFNISGSGNATYKLGDDTEVKAVTNGDVNFGENTSITIKAAPTDGEINHFDVLASGQSIYADDTARNTAKTALTGNDGLTISGLDNTKGYEVNISFSGGGQQQSDNIEVQFDSSSIAENVVTFTVDSASVTVTVSGASISGGKVLVPRNNLASVTFTLGNTYNAETMQAIVRGGDNYSQVLAVNNNTVSLNGLNIPDGGLHFSVEAKSGGGTTDPGPSQSGTEISFAPEAQDTTLTVSSGTITITGSENKALGTVKVYMGNSTEAYTEYQTGTTNEARLSIPENTQTVTIVLAPASGLQGKLIIGGDVNKAGAISNPVYNESAGTYTYTVEAAKIPASDNGSKFVSARVLFGEDVSGSDDVDFTAVIWNGDQVEHQSEHGTISVKSIDVGGTSYAYIDGSFQGDTNNWLEWYKDDNSGETGVRIKDGAFENSNTKVYINFVFKPDYGYQVTGIGTNENATSLVNAGFAAAETISTFTFEVIKHNNPHFSVVFSASEDVTDVTSATGVSAASIANGQNATDSGNLKLTVADLSGNDLSEAQSAFADQMQSTDNTDNVMYLDVDLFQVVSKGTAGSNWETQLTDLNGNISVTLNVGAQAGATYYVIRQHGSGDNVTYTREQATNNGDGTITFTTNQFSNYALFTGAAPYVPPTNNNNNNNNNSNNNTNNNNNSQNTDPTTTDEDGNTTVNVNATVNSEGVAAISEVSDAAISAIVEAEAEQQNVVFDLSGLGDAVNTVTIPSDSFVKVADALEQHEGDDSVTIQTSTGEAQFDETAVQAIAEQATGGKVELTFENVGAKKLNDAQIEAFAEKELIGSYELTLTVNGEPVTEFDGGRVTLTIPLTPKAGTAGRNYKVYYAAEDGKLERMPTSFADNKLSFVTTHFSDYVVAYESRPFIDVESGVWYYEPIYYCYDNEYFYGTGDDCFTPGGTMSRAMFATVLYRIAGEPEVGGTNPFTDVEADKWYTDAVIWAAGENIIKGYGNGIFGTNDSVTREQMVTIFWRYDNSPTAEDADLSKFTDTDKISTWAQDAIEWAVSVGVINGKPGGILDPTGTATRAEVAQIVMNYDTKVE